MNYSINYLLFVIFISTLSSSLSVNLHIISIENPIKNTRNCEKIEIKGGDIYDPLIDHLLEDGCKYPVRQVQLEKEFKEIVYGNISNKTVDSRLKILVDKGLINWKTFKQKNLEIPSEFWEFDGYIFVEDINPICSTNYILLLRICFSKNPTRKFGKPDVFETKDGSLYQFMVEDRMLSSSSCLISGNFGRCKTKPSSIVFQLENKLKSSSIASPIVINSSWTLFGMITTIFFIVILALFGVLLYYKNRKCSEIVENNNRINQKCNQLPAPTSYPEIPFIDDAIVFDI